MLYSSLYNRWLTRRNWLFISILLTGFYATAQTHIPCNEFTADMGYTVKSVTIKGRWVPEKLRKQVEELVGLGGLFDPAKLSAAEAIIRDECVKNEGEFEIELLKGSTSVLFITSQTCDVSNSAETKEVAVVISPYYLRIDLLNIGNNLLPVPRSSWPSFYDQVPALLKATAPKVIFTSDHSYGPAIAVSTSTDLMNLPSQKTKKNLLA